MSLRRSIGLLALAASALAAPITPTAAFAPKGKLADLPPYSGAYQPEGVDERGLWMMADEDERKLRDSKFVIADPALNTYVRRVLCDAVGADRCGGVRLYIVRMPVMNAFMTPNGTMQVWSGLLLRVRSEAELAAVLAHEFAHFEERHGLRSFKQQRAASDIFSWAGMLGTGGLLVQAAAAGSIFSFSRDQERAADERAFKYLAASRYRPGAAAEIWSRAMDEADATALGRKQRSQRYDRLAFFATHPTDLERAATFKKLAAAQGDDGEDAEQAYAEGLGNWRAEFLADQLKLNDFAGTEYLLGGLARSGWTADLLLARGELYRSRGHPRDLVAAVGFYRDAIAKGHVDPACHRGLGMALLRSNQPIEGKAALLEYLKLKPDAADAAMVTMLVDQAGAN